MPTPDPAHAPEAERARAFPQEELAAEARMLLRAQLEYLLDELEAQKLFALRLPQELVSDRPYADSLSMLQQYGLMIAREELLHAPALLSVRTSDSITELSEEELVATEDWNASDLKTLIERLQTARRTTLSALDELEESEWMNSLGIGDKSTEVYHFVHQITQEDADTLRAVASRLNESAFSLRS